MSQILVADIGGTNARFGLVEISPSSTGYEVDSQISLKCAEHSDIGSMIRTYCQQANRDLPAYACLAIAGPIRDGRVKVTNLPWEFTITDLQTELGMTALDVINDFAALAYATPHLPASQKTRLYQAEADPDAPIVVCGPGTGFGMAALIPSGDRWRIVPTEGGHTGFAPATPREIAILQHILKSEPRVSVEHLLSGRGLVTIYRALCDIEQRPAENLAPADVSARGLTDSDPLCRETLNIFCAVLGGVAGDKALDLGARGGVCLGGGIIPRLAEYLPNTQFLARYLDKGPMSGYVQGIPVDMIVNTNAALVGTAAWLVDKVPALKAEATANLSS